MDELHIANQSTKIKSFKGRKVHLELTCLQRENMKRKKLLTLVSFQNPHFIM